MDDHHVRALAPDEMRPALDLFRGALHQPATGDAQWSRQNGNTWRGLGAFAGSELVGTAWSFAARTTVPGGAAVPTLAVSRVGVRADHTRRGHLTALLRTQLTAAADDGDVLAALLASETGIYGRFGFGVATRSEDVVVRGDAVLHPGAPAGGTVRMPPADRAEDEIVALYERLAADRPGTLSRPRIWWGHSRGRILDERRPLGTAVHTGPDGDDGYVVWTTEPDHSQDRDTVRVLDLRAGSPSATTGLWRFLLGLDLAGDVRAGARPRDDGLDLLLGDPRGHRVHDRSDELWLRLLDVPAALAARTWGDAAPVVLRVHDPLFARNDGAVRIGPDGPKPAADGAVADLECDVDGLAPAYLGDRAPSELVTAGRWRAHDPDAVARADALFGTAVVPWCGTFF